MPLPVQLKAVVDEIEFGTEEWRAYINPKAGELATFRGEALQAVEDDDPPDVGWELEEWEDCKRVLEDDDFVKLPSQYDIHEYGIMKRFCLSRDDDGNATSCWTPSPAAAPSASSRAPSTAEASRKSGTAAATAP